MLLRTRCQRTRNRSCIPGYGYTSRPKLPSQKKTSIKQEAPMVHRPPTNLATVHILAVSKAHQKVKEETSAARSKKLRCFLRKFLAGEINLRWAFFCNGLSLFNFSIKEYSFRVRTSGACSACEGSRLNQKFEGDERRYEFWLNYRYAYAIFLILALRYGATLIRFWRYVNAM